ncbi:L-aspartate oxidase [Pseudomonadota bacterium]
MDQYQYDAVIIGGGAAGLSLALHLAEKGRIAVIAKGPLREGATYYAQGGVSAVLDAEDSVASHIEDTQRAGAGLCDPEIVRYTVEHGRESIQWLVECGVHFTQETRPDGSRDFHLTREGGHSHRRILHAADATGKEIENTLVGQLKKHKNIDVLENHIVIDLITGKDRKEDKKRCQGCYALNKKTNEVITLASHFTVLASGGAGKVYLYTSNPDVATGDGIAMAWRAGCRVANMEFVQFHPTCLYHPKAKSFLVTEALRGEGALLRLPDGSRFMDRFHELAELAPRDIVARAIDHEMKRLGIDHVNLDISHKPADFIRSHFPNVYRKCLTFGIDITHEPIPVVPAAHYTCGGVMTDIRGRTDVENLYAIGETAHTGLHGANRMASNSLLECLVFAKAASQDIIQRLGETTPPPTLPEWDESRVTQSREEIIVAHDWDELRRVMWDYVGIVRSNERLNRAMRRIRLLSHEVDEYYTHYNVTNDLLELRNLVLIAKLIVRSALARQESRGLHFTLDYPEADSNHLKNTILKP